MLPQADWANWRCSRIQKHWERRIELLLLGGVENIYRPIGDRLTLIIRVSNGERNQDVAIRIHGKILRPVSNILGEALRRKLPMVKRWELGRGI